MKKIILISLTILVMAINPVFAFTDTGEHWAEKYIDELTEQGIINGYQDGSFKPNNNISIGEFLVITILSYTDRKIDETLGSGKDWAKPYYKKAIEYGFLIDSDTDLKNLDEKISRAQMARILARVSDSKNIKTKNINQGMYELTDFESLKKIDRDGVLKMKSLGVINGYEDQTFRGNLPATRAHVAIMISKLNRIINGDTSEVKGLDHLKLIEGDGINTNEFIIILDYSKNIELQLKETEDYLLTKISINDTEEIMTYIKMKKDKDEVLPERFFDWQKGKIKVYTVYGTTRLIITAL